MRVTVFGSVAFDTVGLVDRLPEPESTARVASLALVPGGAAGNVAARLGALGARPALAATVGPDFGGSAYERALAKLGVDLSRLVRVEEATAHAFIFNAPDGHQVLFFHPGASTRLAAMPVRETDLAHFSAGEIPAYPAHMERAEYVTFDPGQEVYHRPIADIEACLPHVDVWFGNKRELDRLARASPALAIRAMLKTGVDAVVETRGGEGTLVHTAAGSTVIPAVPAQLVDATGAGDAHRAGYLLALAGGLGFEDAARVASASAAFAVETLGPQTSLPDARAVAARYAATFGRWPL
ncbi:MAG TPA: PfkB family carbohydrate kinase [Candidatus Thermoplasmatota archaeon]|nr:PfkB family carbohydrate kinase [Candidatus Thermoplasmatota archaeon]